MGGFLLGAVMNKAAIECGESLFGGHVFSFLLVKCLGLGVVRSKVGLYVTNHQTLLCIRMSDSFLEWLHHPALLASVWMFWPLRVPATFMSLVLGVWAIPLCAGSSWWLRCALSDGK